jgi:hypothetical protein
MQNSKNNLKSPRWCQSLLVESGFGMRSRVFTRPGPRTDIGRAQQRCSRCRFSPYQSSRFSR